MITSTTTTPTTTIGHYMPTNAFLSAALYYAEALNWLVFPLKPQSKIPLTQHGFKDATRNADQIIQWWTQYPDANIAIVTGAESGLFALDVDPRNGGNEDFDQLSTELGINLQLMNTPQSLTGSGGFHLFFQYPATQVIRSGKLSAGIDIKGDGGYVVAPHSIHPNGRAYAWEGESDPQEGIMLAPAPSKLLALLVGKAASQGATVPTYRNQWVDPKQIQELQSALATLSADDYHDWVKVGMSLHSLGNDDIGFRLWDEWSQTSDKYDAREQGKKWRSFEVRRDLNRETIFWMAQQNGWSSLDAMLSPVSIELIPVAEPTPQSIAPVIPSELLNPPGIVGEITDYIISTSQRPQPVFAVNAALSLVATVLGRRVQGPSGLRTNLYLCSLGGTGSGKDHPRKVISKILDAAQKGDWLGGENIASGQAILARASKTPNVLFQLDEFGDFLHAVQNPNSGSHKAEVITNLMRLFGSASGVFRGTEYANQTLRDRQDIEYPCVGLHATTTPETFYPSLGSRDLASGFLNRMLICETDNALPARNRKATLGAVPKYILDWIASIDLIKSPSGNLVGINPAEPLLMEHSNAADALFEELDQFCDQQIETLQGTGVDALWNRATEHAMKISLVLAMGDNAVQVEEDHARWAITFVRHWVQYLANAVQQHVSDSASHALEQEITRLLEKQGSQGLTARELGNYSRKFRAAPPAMRDAALKWLCSSQQIQLAEMNNLRGKKRIAYVLLDDKS